MKFYSYPTIYGKFKEIAKKLHAPESFLEPIPFYEGNLNRQMHFLIESEGSRNQLISELEWYKNQKPYYNFHPAFTKSFSSSRLDFPAKYLHFPYSSLVIQFAENDPNLIFGDMSLRSVLVFTTVQNDKNYLILWIDVGETEPLPEIPEISYPVMTYRNLRWHGEETVEEAIIPSLHPSALEGWQIPDELLTCCLRLIASIAFLATDESPLIIPHILNSDKEKYKKADEKKKKELVHKANQRRKSIGFQVGDETIFDLGKIGQPQPTEDSLDTGRHLQYAHLVTGFWKLVRYGKNLEHGRIRWISPYIRGEGKPFRH